MIENIDNTVLRIKKQEQTVKKIKMKRKLK